MQIWTTSEQPKPINYKSQCDQIATQNAQNQNKQSLCSMRQRLNVNIKLLKKIRQTAWWTYFFGRCRHYCRQDFSLLRPWKTLRNSLFKIDEIVRAQNRKKNVSTALKNLIGTLLSKKGHSLAHTRPEGMHSGAPHHLDSEKKVSVPFDLKHQAIIPIVSIYRWMVPVWRRLGGECGCKKR